MVELPELACARCGRRWDDPRESSSTDWKWVAEDDMRQGVVLYCPDCAPRELGSDEEE